MPVRIGDDILLKVEKPARYTGGEWNMVIKDPLAVGMRFAMCFPDTYEIGMSNLGIKILYHLMNERDDTYCERVFAPWTDMEGKMRESGIPLFALETKDPIASFDMVGFTLQYEMSYTNILNMLDLAGIPLLSRERGQGFPILCAGGPCAFNPAPLAPIFDFFFIGEAEEAINEIIDVYLQHKRRGVNVPGVNVPGGNVHRGFNAHEKNDLLVSLSKVEGVYVPALTGQSGVDAGVAGAGEGVSIGVAGVSIGVAGAATGAAADVAGAGTGVAGTGAGIDVADADVTSTGAGAGEVAGEVAGAATGAAAGVAGAGTGVAGTGAGIDVADADVTSTGAGAGEAAGAPKDAGVGVRVRKRAVANLDEVYYPDRIIVPHIGIVHDRIMLEIFRGCSRGCRFCQAGYIYRPVRERSAGRLAELGSGLVAATGYDEVSLSSLSTSDYSSLEELTGALSQRFNDAKVSLSLPSMRIDSFSAELMKKASIIRKSGITLAPEAGTQRLRDVINKGVTEEDLLNSVRIAFEGGWNNLKLYFMIGLPTETEEDIEGIAALAEKVAGEYFRMPRDKRRKKLNITVSVATFVPKPHTPFQWEAQASLEQLTHRITLLRSLTRANYINLIWHDPKLSIMEAIFARGDERMCDVLIEAWRKGCRFDGWDEHFRYGLWMEAFAEFGVDPSFYTTRVRPYGETMPWSRIDPGVTEKYLYNERNKAYKGELTPDCRLNCTGCGISSFMECG